MSLPVFYVTELAAEGAEIVLSEDTSRHVIQVLRMQPGEKIKLTDGLGSVAETVITDAHKKKSLVKIESIEKFQQEAVKKIIAISPIKNSSRFEWFLEKATEIGINEIIPILCAHTEKTNLKKERLQNILVSAMLQSQQSFLPLLHEPVSFSTFIEKHCAEYKFIAHCAEDDRKLPLQEFTFPHPGDVSLLIGPEGDFSASEIKLAEQHNYLPVSLGNTRLRTETAGVFGAVLLSTISRIN